MRFLSLFFVLGGLVWATDASALTRKVLNRRVQSGQTLAHALHSVPLPNDEVDALTRSLADVFDFKRVRPGDQLRLVFDDDVLVLLDIRQGPVDEWQARRGPEGSFTGTKRDISQQQFVSTVEFTIEGSLYGAVTGAKETPELAVALGDVLAWEVDFYMDPRPGDRARVVVEKFMSKGKLVRYGAILAAEYDGKSVGKKRVFRWQNPEGTLTYFAQDGQSARKAFLKSPLNGASITSRFGNRFHPVLQYMKAHQGVDYGAGIGTPVWAVADGTVMRAGPEGAAGNLLVIRHSNGFESYYMHLSRFGRGVRSGARVQQKQVVAYTGNTGRTTGPHLHYGLKRGGAWTNPLNQNFPRSEPLKKEWLPAFSDDISPLVAVLDGTQPDFERAVAAKAAAAEAAKAAAEAVALQANAGQAPVGGVPSAASPAPDAIPVVKPAGPATPKRAAAVAAPTVPATLDSGSGTGGTAPTAETKPAVARPEARKPATPVAPVGEGNGNKNETLPSDSSSNVENARSSDAARP